MRSLRITLVVVVLLLAAGNLPASGPVGIYGIIEKTVFEPNEASPERIQLWGAFALVGGGVGGQGVLPAQRGYLYFRLPTASEARNETTLETMKKEWKDLKAVAGTGQAVGFGNWFYTGALDSNQIYPQTGGSQTNLTIRRDSEKPNAPSIYSTNAGIVKLNPSNHAAVIENLRQALRSPGR